MCAQELILSQGRQRSARVCMVAWGSKVSSKERPGSLFRAAGVVVKMQPTLIRKSV